MAKPGLKINIYSRFIIQTGTKDPCHVDDRWAETFSPCWYYEPGLKGPLVSAAKNVEANVKLGHRSKVCSLVVYYCFSFFVVDNDRCFNDGEAPEWSGRLGQPIAAAHPDGSLPGMWGSGLKRPHRRVLRIALPTRLVRRRVLHIALIAGGTQ